MYRGLRASPSASPLLEDPMRGRPAPWFGPAELLVLEMLIYLAVIKVDAKWQNRADLRNPGPGRTVSVPGPRGRCCLCTIRASAIIAMA
jgi:hypothetical protein